MIKSIKDKIAHYASLMLGNGQRGGLVSRPEPRDILLVQPTEGRWLSGRGIASFLTSEQFRMALTEELPNASTIVAQYLRITEQELYERLQAGDVSVDSIREAIVVELMRKDGAIEFDHLALSRFFSASELMGIQALISRGNKEKGNDLEQS